MIPLMHRFRYFPQRVLWQSQLKLRWKHQLLTWPQLVRISCTYLLDGEPAQLLFAGVLVSLCLLSSLALSCFRFLPCMLPRSTGSAVLQPIKCIVKTNLNGIMINQAIGMPLLRLVQIINEAARKIPGFSQAHHLVTHSGNCHVLCCFFSTVFCCFSTVSGQQVRSATAAAVAAALDGARPLAVFLPGSKWQQSPSSSNCDLLLSSSKCPKSRKLSNPWNK